MEVKEPFCTHIFKETKVGWCSETPFRYTNLESKVPYIYSQIIGEDDSVENNWF